MLYKAFSLTEVMVALTVLAIAVAGTSSIFATHLNGERFTEERRIALQAAVEKVDEIRANLANMYTNSGNTAAGATGGLNAIFSLYKPWITASDGTAITSPSFNPSNPQTRAAFKVPGLTTNNSNSAYKDFVGTVSLIIDERPNENSYGVDYSAPPSSGKWKMIGVDISGNGNFMETIPPPFPMDLDNDGVNTGNLQDDILAAAIDEPRLWVLPVVVTIHWDGIYGSQRIDFFTILAPDRENN